MKKKRNQQLQLKLKSHAPTTTTILGKREGRPDEELDDDSPSRISHSSLIVEVAMDCEMVGVGQGNKSALGHVTLVNRWGNVVYDEFVRPVECVVDFRTEISGIRPRDLRKGIAFKSSQGGHQGYIRV